MAGGGALGFTGGRILEPAAGIGHFIGAMPRNLAERSSITAVEIDRVSGRILNALYAPGGVDVRISPFEKTPLPDHWFDLVIGNVPFGKYKVADVSNRAYARFSIHNYFFGRASTWCGPGGLVCFITSSQHDGCPVRRGATTSPPRLTCWAPSDSPGLFAGIASTEVQTDILFLRKRQRAEAVEAKWLKLGTVPIVSGTPSATSVTCRSTPGTPSTRISALAASAARAMATRKYRSRCSRATWRRPGRRIALLPAGEPAGGAQGSPLQWWSRPRPVPVLAATVSTRGGASGRGRRDGRRP